MKIIIITTTVLIMILVITTIIINVMVDKVFLVQDQFLFLLLLHLQEERIEECLEKCAEIQMFENKHLYNKSV